MTQAATLPLSAIVLALTVSSCQVVPPSPMPQAAPVATSAPLAEIQQFIEARRQPPKPGRGPGLQPGDRFQLREPTMEEVTGTYVVSKEGEVNFPVLGKVVVGGLNIAEVESTLNRRLEVFMFNPRAEIEISGAKAPTALVEGAVTHPGEIELAPDGTTLLEAISLAGGLSHAAGSIIRLVPAEPAESELFADPEAARMLAERAGGIEIPTFALLQAGATKLFLWPGDQVEVLRAGEEGARAAAAGSAPSPVSATSSEGEVSPEIEAARAELQQRRAEVRAERAEREEELSQVLDRIRALPVSADRARRSALYDEANRLQLEVQRLQQVEMRMRAPLNETAIRGEGGSRRGTVPAQSAFQP